MKEKQEYLPCPFCGWEVVETKEIEEEIQPNCYVARCQNCQATSPKLDTVRQCKDAWNRRTPIVQH